MFRIKKSYFNEALIEAIVPRRCSQMEDGPDAEAEYSVFMSSGTAHCVTVSEDELKASLLNAGLLNIQAPVSVTLSPQDEDNLQRALADGYRYIARDKTQQVFAYVRKPVKGEASWRVAHGDTAPRRIKGDFDFLDWADEEPTEIALLLGFSPMGVEA